MLSERKHSKIAENPQRAKNFRNAIWTNSKVATSQLAFPPCQTSYILAPDCLQETWIKFSRDIFYQMDISRESSARAAEGLPFFIFLCGKREMNQKASQLLWADELSFYYTHSSAFYRMNFKRGINQDVFSIRIASLLLCHRPVAKFSWSGFGRRKTLRRIHWTSEKFLPTGWAWDGMINAHLDQSAWKWARVLYSHRERERERINIYTSATAAAGSIQTMRLLLY